MPNKLFSSRSTLFSIAILVFLALVFGWLFFSIHFRPGPPPASAKSPDAIGVRVIANPSNYSPSRWYQSQGFTGSPQSLAINGYEAIRDGRSVYANAANISGNNLYTNIYVISYNQDAEQATKDIFDQILKYWKFNTNLTISSSCSLATTTVCLIDPECPKGDYCQSDKAKATRDVKRLADLSDITQAITAYKAAHNGYPRLLAGTYVPNNSLSVWPSWQDNLAKDLVITLPVDPINRLGSCPGYNTITCWDELNKKYNDPTPGDGKADGPPGSYVYRYTSLNSFSYEFCAPQETNYTIFSNNNYNNNFFCLQDFLNNSAPQFTSSILPAGKSGVPYSGFISATDADGDPITWTWSAPGLWPNWLAAPILRDPVPAKAGTKEVYSPQAGDEGVYQISVTIDDGRGMGNSVQTKTFTINITNDAPVITVPIAPQTVVIGKALNSFTIKASDLSLNYPLTFSTGAIADFNPPLTGMVLNQHDYQIAGNPVINNTGAHTYQITAFDSYNKPSAPANFTITVTNQPPQITSGPMPDGTACVIYPNFQIVASDPDGHNIAYSISGVPGLAINNITGLITGIPTAAALGNKTAIVTVDDQYASLSTDPLYPGSISVNYPVTISNEVFTVSVALPPPANLYVAPPGVLVASLYEGPVSYIAVSSDTTNQGATYSKGAGSPPLFVIAPNGNINATATNNTNDPGNYNISVIATNGCGVSYSAPVALNVLKNYWCGDNTVNSPTKNYGEQCELPGNGTDINNQWECNNCQWAGGYCGDGNKNLAYEACDTTGGNGTSNTDQYACANCAWSGGWCGDAAIQAAYGEQCDGANLNGQDCNSVDPTLATGAINAGKLACDSGCKFNTSACIPYCVFGGPIPCVIQ